MPHAMKPKHNTFNLLGALALSLAILLAIMALTSCQLTVSSDGSRTWSFDAENAARAIIIYEGK